MQMNQRCGGRFHHQSVSCRSDFEETRRMSSFFLNPTTPLVFACESYYETTLYFNKRLFIFDAKLLQKARGVSPVQTMKNT